jgi:hypothetical protein
MSNLHSGNFESSPLFSWQNALDQIHEAFLERLIGMAKHGFLLSKHLQK